MTPISLWPFRVRAGCAVLGVLTVLAFAPASAADECRQKRIADIPARIAPDHRLLISADLDGKPVELRLDTGLGISALSRSLVLRLGLPIETVHDIRYQTALNSIFKQFNDPPQDARTRGYSGSELTERTRIPKLILGGALTEYEEFGVVPIGSDGLDGRPVGVFGTDYLLSYDVELDPGANRVRLFEQDHCGDRVVYWSREYSVLPLNVDDVTRWATTEVELDGHKLRALIDTGREYTTMPLGAADRVFGLTETSPGVTADGNDIGRDGRSTPRYASRFKSLKLGDLEIGNPLIMLETLRLMRQTPTNTHIARAAEVAPDIIIGENLLRKMRLYFAFKDSVAYFTLVAPPPPDRN